MTHYVFDTSALVKAYLPEVGSARVLDLLQTTATGSAKAVVSALAYPETVSAVARRERNARITPVDAAARITRIDSDFTGPRPPFSIVGTTSALTARAAALVRPHALSGTDAVHLATAFTLQTAVPDGDTLTLVSTDARLLAAARAEGLAVDDLS